MTANSRFLILISVLALTACGEATQPAAESEPAQPAAAEAGATANVLAGMPSGTYALDKKHGYVTFSYNHLGFSNPHVGFNDFDAALILDPADPANSTLEVMIDATSIDSRVDEFDGHLKGERFFDVANYPTITFSSTAVRVTGDNTLDVEGDLTIKGTTKSIVLSTTINKAGNHPMANVPNIGVSATTKLNRSDFGLDYAVPAVSDEVTLYVDVELLQRAAE